MPIIRPARRDDIDSLASMLKTLFSIEADFAFNEPMQRRGLEMMVDSGRGCLLVAEEDNRVIGMCSGQFTVSTAEGGLALLVEDVVVRQEWRGRGVGRLLMEELGAWARRYKVSRLQLLADRNNSPALEFYRHLGWQTTDLICLRNRL